MKISDAAIRNRTSVGVFVLLIIVIGAYSYYSLPRESFPDVPIPYILVSTAYEGVSPEDVESSITAKIEKELAGLKGVKEITSTSAEGLSVVVIEFYPSVVVEDALQYVRDRVDRAKPELPDEAKEPFLKEINVADFPVIMVSVSGNVSAVQLKLVADELEESIEQLPGVLNVDVLGALEREIRLEIDRDRLTKSSLTIPELLALIPAENLNISAGSLETEGTRFNVRVPAEFADPADAHSLLLAVRGGRPIYLADVASVSDTFKDPTSFSRLDGADSVTVSVQKRIGANVLQLSDDVKAAIERVRKTAPEGMRFDITLDHSDHVRRMVLDLENNIACGLVLVLLVMVLFVGFRASTIVSLAIPLSMLMSFGAISMLGYTLNMIVLFSLVLSLGMLVDNAIVIVENIYRHRQLGYNKTHAAILGTREVAWPITASTATTVAAFLPMLFWPGVMGNFMKYLPITVIITLSSSLFVALVVNPTVSSVFAGVPKERRRHIFIHAYHSILHLSLRHRFTTIILAVLLLIGLSAFYAKSGNGVQFFPEGDPDQAIVNIRCPQGTNIRETDRLTRICEARVEKYRSELKYLSANVGSAGEFSFHGSSSGPHVGNLTIIFNDYETRRRSSADALAEIRRDLADIAGAEIKVERQKGGPPTGAPVTVRFIGKDFRELERLSEMARHEIADVSGMVNLRSDLEATKPELVFRVDRRRAMLAGVNTAVIGRFLKMAIFGSKVSTFREYNDEHDITVRLPVEQRMNVDDLLALQVPNSSGKAIPLSSLGSPDYRGGFGTIRRVNQKRVVTLTADNEGRLSTEVLNDVKARIDAKLKPILPLGYEISYAGEKEEQDESAAFLTKAFIVALLVITLILVMEFNSIAVPAIIMFTVVLSLVGVFAGLLICGQPFGIIMTGIGVISLAGVVVNNAIVLLDYTRQLERRGLGLVEAAVQAGETRLRPVLLTATTTVISLVPMATGISYDFHTLQWATKSQSSQWWSGMAIAVIFGLTFATVLTLVVVPTLYVLFYKLFPWFAVKPEKDADEPSYVPVTPAPDAHPEPAT